MLCDTPKRKHTSRRIELCEENVNPRSQNLPVVSRIDRFLAFQHSAPPQLEIIAAPQILSQASAAKGARNQRRMTSSTLTAWPPGWGLPQPPAGVTWLQRDLQQRQLQAIPPIRDGDGAKPQGSSTSELPPDLVEELDLPGLLDTVRSPRPVAPPPAGTYHAALRLQSNHIGSVEPGAFAALPWLCGLDLSLNHLEALVLTPETVPRLRTLCLRNNRLLSVAPLGELLSLRQLDVSLNQIESLEGESE